MKANERYGANRSRLYNWARRRQAKRVGEWMGNLTAFAWWHVSRVLEIGPGAHEMQPVLDWYGHYHTQDIAEPAVYILSLPNVAQGPWSLIYAAHVLEHLPTHAHVVKAGQNMAANLSPGGLLVLQVPDYGLWGEDFWDVDLTHGVPFTRRRVRQLADLSGLTVERMTLVTGPLVGPLAYVVSWLWRQCKPLLAISHRVRQAGYSLNGDLLVALRKPL